MCAESQKSMKRKRGRNKRLAWLARAMPLNAAASKLDPNSQSPHMPALPRGSKMQGMPGEFVGSAAPLLSYKQLIQATLTSNDR